jgi:TolA-binding protein
MILFYNEICYVWGKGEKIMKHILQNFLIVLALLSPSFGSDEMETESPEAMDPTGDEESTFVGERVSEDPASNVQDLKSEVNSLKIRMDELLREMAVMKRNNGETKGTDKGPYHGSSGDITSADHHGVDAEDEDVLNMLDEASLSDSGGKSPVEEKRKIATKEAEKHAPNLPAGNALAQYNEAFALYKKAAYPEAQRAFHYVIKAYPKDSVAKKSHYWLGECAIAQKEYGSARKYYAKAYEVDKKGPNAADCLYKLGLTFASEKKKGGACTAWKKLTIDYPNMSKALKEKVAKAQKANKCS